jgi:hypothetical protein
MFQKQNGRQQQIEPAVLWRDSDILTVSHLF